MRGDADRLDSKERHGVRHRVACALVLSGALLVPQITLAWCFDRAAASTGLNPGLLRAIAAAESDLNPGAVNRSHRARTGTVDVGLMQINTSWLPSLRRHGIDEAQLFEPCTNVQVGAWILADLVARLGDRWEAVGAYNASCSRLGPADCQATRQRYAWRVHRRLPGPAASTVSLHAAPEPRRARESARPPGGLLAFSLAAAEPSPER